MAVSDHGPSYVQPGWEEKQMKDGRIFFVDHGECILHLVAVIHLCGHVIII